MEYGIVIILNLLVASGAGGTMKWSVFFVPQEVSGLSTTIPRQEIGLMAKTHCKSINLEDKVLLTI